MEEIEARVTALETDMHLVKQDAAAARVLAGGADRDVSAFGAKLDMHKTLLEALRKTQVEQGIKMGVLLETQVEQGTKMEVLLETQAEQGTKMEVLVENQVEQGQKLEEHSQEFANIRAEMRGGFARMDSEFADVRGEVDTLQGEMRGGFAMLAAGQARITTLLEGIGAGDH
jgi:hypothetical protein